MPSFNLFGPAVFEKLGCKDDVPVLKVFPMNQRNESSKSIESIEFHYPGNFCTGQFEDAGFYVNAFCCPNCFKIEIFGEFCQNMGRFFKLYSVPLLFRFVFV